MKRGRFFILIVLVLVSLSFISVVSASGIDYPLKKIPVKSCSGEGDLYLYQENPFQNIDTSFTVWGDEVLVFAGGDVTLSAKVDGVSKSLTLVKEETSLFHVKIYSLKTNPGAVVSISGTHEWGARAVQGYLSQNSDYPVFNPDTLEIVYDDEKINHLNLTPDIYSYIFFDKYSENIPGEGIDDRKLRVIVDGPTGSVVNKLYTQPFPSPVEGAVIDEFFANKAGKYKLSVQTEDSIYWMIDSCRELPFCGDGMIDIVDGEQCDDGNNVNGDGCSSTCQIEERECIGADYIFNVNMWVVGQNCHPSNHIQDSVAVNVDKGTYKVEAKSHRGNPGQTQTNEAFFLEINGQDSFISEDDADPSIITTRLEDFGEFEFKQGSNNIIMNTAAQCPPDTTPNSVEVSKICLYLEEPVCGNGEVEVGELCDDGINNGVACEPGYEGICSYCSSECEPVVLKGPFCGDGHKDAPHEECDGNDGVGPNQVCNAECELIDIPHCGNGIKEAGEECDDGNSNNFDSCRNDCTLPFCGDGIKDIGEQCDDGNNVNGDGCSSTCQIEEVPKCGNGIVESGEECDDGNHFKDDKCSNQCTLTFCGDDIIQEPNGVGLGGPLDDGFESCDDGANNDLMNSCTDVCTLTFCGDGFVQTPNGLGINEQCDDGNAIDGDGCSSSCRIEERECVKDSDCSDGLFCNGKEKCIDYECVPGTPPQVDDGLFCTNDFCDESKDKIVHKPIDVDDGIACTNDFCDETKNKIIHEPDDSVCNNGLFCDGVEFCDPYYGCQSGTPVDCSANDLPEINMCMYEPDGNPLTLDHAPGFTSVCDEATDSCTTGSYEFTHTCNVNMCGAECELGQTKTINCGTDVGECEFGEITLECTAECLFESDEGKICIGGIGPKTEICDGKDNDCDGQTDEGLVDNFDKISYSTTDTGEVILLNGYSEFKEENIDFFHGYIHERNGEFIGEGSLHARGTLNNGTELQLNLKFKVTGLIEHTCEKLIWRNSARGTWWIEGKGTEEVTYEYMDITYHLLTGEIDAVGFGDTDFEFIDMMDDRFEG